MNKGIFSSFSFDDFRCFFSAVEISDTGLDKSSLIQPDLISTEHEQNLYSIDRVALKNEFSSMITNIE